jgi:hypothetical protein
MTNALRCRRGLGVVAVVLAGASNVGAAVIWDYSPSTTGSSQFPYWSNQPTQYFAEDVSFPSGATVNGIAIYSAPLWGYRGQSTTVRVWADSGGIPGALLLTIPTFVSAVDADGCVGDCTRKFASFAAITLLANTNYWIGMSGTVDDLAQSGLINPGAPDDGRMAQFHNGVFFDVGGYGDQAFRLYGDAAVAPIPEPGTLTLLGFGLGALRLYRRRRARTPFRAPAALVSRPRPGRS